VRAPLLAVSSGVALSYIKSRWFSTIYDHSGASIVNVRRPTVQGGSKWNPARK